MIFYEIWQYFHEICWNLFKNQWNSMKIHETQWNFMKSDKIFMTSAEIYRKIDEILWKYIKFNETLWNLMIFSSNLLKFIKKSMTFYENPWNSMKSYEIW